MSHYSQLKVWMLLLTHWKLTDEVYDIFLTVFTLYIKFEWPHSAHTYAACLIQISSDSCGLWRLNKWVHSEPEPQLTVICDRKTHFCSVLLGLVITRDKTMKFLMNVFSLADGEEAEWWIADMMRLGGYSSACNMETIEMFTLVIVIKESIKQKCWCNNIRPYTREAIPLWQVSPAQC